MSPIDMRNSIVPGTLTKIKMFTGNSDAELEQRVNAWSAQTGNLIVSASAPVSRDAYYVTVTVVYISALEIADAKEVSGRQAGQAFQDLARHSSGASDAEAIDGRFL
jgi:hypothetical protein